MEPRSIRDTSWIPLRASVKPPCVSARDILRNLSNDYFDNRNLPLVARLLQISTWLVGEKTRANVWMKVIKESRLDYLIYKKKKNCARLNLSIRLYTVRKWSNNFLEKIVWRENKILWKYTRRIRLRRLKDSLKCNTVVKFLFLSAKK